MDHPASLDAITARNLIANGELSPVELVASCIETIESVDGCVNAMVTRAFDRATGEARAAAEAVTRGEPLGPLHGLPIAIKDIQATEGIATTFGSADLADNVPAEDAPIVARIRRAGAIIIGKTNVPEHSIGANTVNRLFGATGNPFDPARTCGGSSGGSAVALATHMAPLATGSDHGGSLRIPACFCGVVGFRATPGIVPNEGRTVTQTNYSVQGPMARSVADAALLLSVIANRDPASRADPMAFPLDAARLGELDDIDAATLRVAASEDLGGLMVSKATRATFADRARRIEPYVGRLDFPDLDLADAPGVDWHLRQELFLAQYHDRADDWDEGFNPNVRATWESAIATPLRDVAGARRMQMALYQRIARLFDDHDVLICPGVSISPFPWTELNPSTIDGQAVENYMAWLQLTAALTVVGHPVVALPCGLDDQGMPFGIQVVGRMYGDREVLSAAHALEQAFAGDPALARPQPDLDLLAGATSDCRTAGKHVQTS